MAPPKRIGQETKRITGERQVEKADVVPELFDFASRRRFGEQAKSASIVNKDMEDKYYEAHPEEKELKERASLPYETLLELNKKDNQAHADMARFYISERKPLEAIKHWWFSLSAFGGKNEFDDRHLVTGTPPTLISPAPISWSTLAKSFGGAYAGGELGYLLGGDTGREIGATAGMFLGPEVYNRAIRYRNAFLRGYHNAQARRFGTSYNTLLIESGPLSLKQRESEIKLLPPNISELLKIEQAYQQAINSGNLKEALRLRDLHFELMSIPVRDRNNNVQHNYHATKAKFNSFDLSKAGSGSGNTINTEGTIHFSPYKEAALDVFRPKSIEEKNSFNIIDAYIHNPNPVYISLEDFIRSWNDKESFIKYRDAGDGIIARASKTPEQIYKEKIEAYLKAVSEGKVYPWTSKPESPKEFMEEATVDGITINKPEYIKLADAVTYDDNGQIIPLSMRDDFTNPDIRYSIAYPDEFVRGTKLYLDAQGKIDTSLVIPEFKLGKLEALDYFYSPTYKAMLEKNNALYRRMFGKDLTNSVENSTKRTEPTIKVKLEYDPDAGEAASIGLANGDIIGAEDDRLLINTAFPNVDSNVFHEMLHRGNFGKPIRPATWPTGYWENTYTPEYSFWRFKEKMLMDPDYRAAHPDSYILGDGEGFTNLLLMGRGAGLEFGQPYPGAEVTNAVLDKIESENILGKGFIVPMLNRNKPRRLWEAMTGQYYTDPFGKEIIPTSYTGELSDFADATQMVQRKVLQEYFGPLKIELIKNTMGWGDTEMKELLNELLRNLGTVAKTEVKGLDDGFKFYAQHSGSVIGQGDKAQARHTITYNKDRTPTYEDIIENATHEIGGHAKTVSISPEEYKLKGPSYIFKQSFPRIAELMEKNKLIADEVLILNDATKELVNSGVDSPELRHFKYVNTDLEKYARGYAGQLMEKLMPGYKTSNIKQLEQYFTPESVEAFKNKLLQLGIIVGAGSSLLLDNNEQESYKQGGRLIPKAKSGIHIKKKNRGKFTEYCGGKVTDECILKAKHSSNPTLRKRATFALNARKWSKKK